MAILRCPHCQFLKEVANQHLGKTAPCPKCKQTAKVVDTIKLVEAAVKQYQKANQDFNTLKHVYEKTQAKLAQLTQTHQNLQKQFTNLQQTELKAHDTPLAEGNKGYAFSHQEASALLNNFQPVIEWFRQRNIVIEPNVKGSDISGYFDEIAVMLGDNLQTFDALLDGIRYRQRKGYDRFTFELNDYTHAEAKLLKDFCKQAYEYAFFTRQHFIKNRNAIAITLNNSPQIQNFFNGDWLEWYCLMKVASFLLAKKLPFACLRSSIITSAQQHEQNELDTFFLVNGKPLWIECKSGEFRDSINKYQELRKRLNIDPNHAILLVSGLEDEKAHAMSSMFKLQILNEKGLLPYLEGLF